jgi:chromosomal replication initiator protein
VLNSAEQDARQEAFFSAIQQRVNARVFDTWFKPLRLEKVDHPSRVLYLFAPNPVVKDWIASHYKSALEESLGDLRLAGYRIEWGVSHGASPGGTDAPAYPSTGAATAGNNIPDTADEATLSALLEKAPARDVAATVSANYSGAPPSPLNPKYSFDTFVVGSCNEFAHAAAQNVADAPGKTYNPLYIYGGVGLGKTHLMQAAGAAIRQRNPSLRVSYISLESFMNELINAIRYGYDKTHAFRERYRSIDVLLMDDIQFIAGKERTQEEFFHTFNALYELQKQIVISSDCPPREIPNIEERLHSRFEWGLIADIEPPDLETKIAILKGKAELEGIVLPDDVALYIANSVKHNIRELEGSLVRLLAMSSLRGLPITKMLAQDALRSIADVEEESISIARIQRTVAAHYRLKVEELVAKSNTRRISLPRQVAMYLCKRLTKHSYPEIGRQFSGKHHTTVMHSVEKIERLVATEPEFHKVVSGLMDRICR